VFYKGNKEVCSMSLPSTLPCPLMHDVIFCNISQHCEVTHDWLESFVISMSECRNFHATRLMALATWCCQVQETANEANRNYRRRDSVVILSPQLSMAFSRQWCAIVLQKWIVLDRSNMYLLLTHVTTLFLWVAKYGSFRKSSVTKCYKTMLLGY